MDSPRLILSSSKISISITNNRPSNQFGILGLEGDFRLICMSHIKHFFPVWDGFSYVVWIVQDVRSVVCCSSVFSMRKVAIIFPDPPGRTSRLEPGAGWERSGMERAWTDVRDFRTEAPGKLAVPQPFGCAPSWRNHNQAFNQHFPLFRRKQRNAFLLAETLNSSLSSRVF